MEKPTRHIIIGSLIGLSVVGVGVLLAKIIKASQVYPDFKIVEVNWNSVQSYAVVSIGGIDTLLQAGNTLHLNGGWNIEFISSRKSIFDIIRPTQLVLSKNGITKKTLAQST